MKEKFLKIFSILFLSFVFSGYGYVGDLPVLTSPVSDTKEETPPTVEEIRSIMQKNNPNINSILQAEKYKDFYKDLDESIIFLENAKDSLKNYNDIRYLYAFSNTLNLYVENFGKKYQGKEKYQYELYENMKIVADAANIFVAQCKNATETGYVVKRKSNKKTIFKSIEESRQSMLLVLDYALYTLQSKREKN